MRIPRRALRALAAALLAVAVIPAQAGAIPGSPPGRPAIAPAATDGLEFGEVTVGTTSTPLDVVYGNATGSPQTVLAQVDGDHAGEFTVVGGTCLAGPVDPGSSCTVSVAFAPTGEYHRTATLHLTDGVPTVRDLSLVGVGVLPEAAVAWSSERNIGSAYTYTAGAALGRTVTSSGQWLHAIVQRYDTPRVGVYYRRSTAGTRWVDAIRVNPSSQHGGRSALAAAGTRVYVVWSSLASANPSGSRPRALWFRRASDHGARWSSPVRLTSATGRIDYPKVAASGRNVYIVYTDSVTGSVKAKISRDRGGSWSTTSLGSTSRTGTSGRIGVPVVAASGSTVAVAWLANDEGTVRFRSSSDGGRTWSSASTLGTGAAYGSWPSVAALGSRVAVAWTGADAMVVRLREGGVFGPALDVRPSAGAERAYELPWIGQVVLNGADGLGIAFEACWAGCSGTAAPEDYRSDIVWRESADDGASWSKSQAVIATGEDIGEYLYAYMPSVLWPAASERYVMAAHWYGPNELDNVVIRKGSGAP